MEDRTLAVIGAAGEMASLGVERLVASGSDWQLALYDRDRAGLERLAAKLPPGRADVATIDLFDERALRRAIGDATLVVLGAGPYLRTRHRCCAPASRRASTTSTSTTTSRARRTRCRSAPGRAPPESPAWSGAAPPRG